MNLRRSLPSLLKIVIIIKTSVSAWHAIPSSIPMRMIFLVGIFCGVVTYVAYSGEIVSTLAVSVVPVNKFIQLITYRFVFTVHEWSEPFQAFLKVLYISLYELLLNHISH
jgi:hypothetical protein